MPLPRISLQALDAFERVARSGSIQITAAEMELSISSVSHHITRLEDQLGALLFDRSTRPFRLTREGEQALQHLSKGLLHIRRATNETAVSGLLKTRSLRIGIIEEFESTVTPELASFLTRQMPQAALSIRNILSHEAPALLKKGEIDLAVATKTEGNSPEIKDVAVMRDPYVVALPAGVTTTAKDVLTQANTLDFLRFNQNHLIGKQIESHLARNLIDLPSRYAFDSVQSILATVADGAGWSIVTPLGFMRAQRFAASVRLHPLPLPASSRIIALVTRENFDLATRTALTELLRQIIEREVVHPACRDYPWLKERLTTEV